MLAVPSILINELHRLGDDSRRTVGPGDSLEQAADIEELVSKAVHLYSRLNRQHERWANPIRQGLCPFNLEDARPWQAAFQEWADQARSIVRAGRAFEEKGIFIDQLDILRGDLRHCPYDGLSIDRLVASSHAHGPGKGISGAELKNELQSRLRAPSG